MPKVIINFSPKNLHLTKLLVNLREAQLHEKNVKMEEIVNQALDNFFEDICNDTNHKRIRLTQSIRSIIQLAESQYQILQSTGDASIRKRKK